MNALYPTFTTAELRDNPAAIYKATLAQPVVVYSRATPQVVCVNPAEWNRIARLLEDQEDLIASLKAELALATGEDQASEVTDFTQFRTEMMEDAPRVPSHHR